MFTKFTRMKNNYYIKDNISGARIYFAMLALIISAVLFFLFLEKYKQYNSEISIIFVPKSEMAAQDAERIIENMQIFPTKAFFYDKMAMFDENIKNKISNFSAVKITRERRGSIMKISALSENREDSIAVSKIAATTLFNTMGFYYDIKKDADFRIVEDPIAHTTNTNLIFILISSLLAGIVSAFTLVFIFQKISNYLEKKPGSKKEAEIFFEISKGTKAKPEIQKEEEVYEIKPKTPTVSAPSEKKSPVPVNLPSAPGELVFIDEDYFRNNIIKNGKIEPKKESEEAPAEKSPKETSIEASGEIKTSEPVDFHREPTSEEFKKRLNQLLRGEL